MKTDIRIGNREIITALITLLCTKLLLTFPRGMITVTGNSAYIQGIYIIGTGLIIYFLSDRIYISKKTVLDIAEDIGGGIFKKITGIIVVFILIVNMAITLRVYPESVRLVLLQNTPVIQIMALFCIAIIAGAYAGIESLCRINFLFLPIMGAILAIFFVMLFPFFKTTNLAPVFSSGSKSIFVDGLESMSFFLDIFALNFLLPYCKSKRDGFRCGYHAIFISGLIMLTIIFALCAVFPESVSNEFIMPVYQLTRILQVGDFLARFEAFFEFIWSIAVFLYSSVYLYIITNVIKETFDLRLYKPLIAPVMIISSAAAFLPQSVPNLLGSYSALMFFLYIASAVIPLFFGILDRIKNN